MSLINKKKLSQNGLNDLKGPENIKYSIVKYRETFWAPNGSSVTIINFQTLRKRAYANILKFSPQNIWKFSDKNSDIFHISAQNIYCGYTLEPPRRGGSNEYPQSMFWAKIRKIIYTPLNPSFTIWKWGLRGLKLYRYVFVMTTTKHKHIHTHTHTHTHKQKNWKTV